MSEKKAPAKRKSRATIKAEEGEEQATMMTSTGSSSRKRRAAARELLPHPSTENRQSELIPVPPHILDRQRTRRLHPLNPSDPPYRRDMRSTPRHSVSNITQRQPRSRRSSMQSPERNMLQHAWHTAMNTDPLVDSDEECRDVHIRADYVKRMHVISRLRGRPPTPEEEAAYAPSWPLQFEAHTAGGAL